MLRARLIRVYLQAIAVQQPDLPKGFYSLDVDNDSGLKKRTGHHDKPAEAL